MEDILCECGHTQNPHIDGEGRCVIPECQCQEFIIKDEEPADFSGASDIIGETNER